MLDFEIQKFTRRCAKTDREFGPNESFYSLLVSEDGEVLRQDFSEEAWEGPPENAIGWWKSQTADSHAKKASWAPNDVMLDFFQQLEDQPEKGDVRYVLTLLMIRRRIMRLEESETDDQGRELLVVYCPRSEVEYRVPVITPNRPRAAEIQDELTSLLFTEAT